MRYAPPPALPVISRYGYRKRSTPHSVNYIKQESYKHSEPHSSPKRKKLKEPRMRTKSIQFNNGLKSDDRIISAGERRVSVVTQPVDNRRFNSGHSSDNRRKGKKRLKETDIQLSTSRVKKKRWQEKLTSTRVVEVCEEVQATIESRTKKVKKKKKKKKLERETEKHPVFKVGDHACCLIVRRYSRDN